MSAVHSIRVCLEFVVLTLQVASLDALPMRRLVAPSRYGNDAGEDKCDPMFVTIVSSPHDAVLRNSIREVWRDTKADWGDATSTYVFCTKQGVSCDLQHEQDMYGDLLFVERL